MECTRPRFFFVCQIGSRLIYQSAHLLHYCGSTTLLLTNRVCGVVSFVFRSGCNGGGCEVELRPED